MIILNEVQIELLVDLIESGYIRSSKHPNKDLYILKYTEKCVFEGVWNELTLLCRGLIINSEYKIIGRCMKKFFNYNESSAFKDWNQPFEVFEKMDGSLIQIFKYKGDTVISSAGSLDCDTSDYIKTAHKLFIKQGLFKHITDNETFIFELISPLSRVVVNYGDIEELRLITIVDNNTGSERIDYQDCFKTVNRYTSHNCVKYYIDELNDDFSNREGYVIKFQDGNRIKLKYSSYIQLHKTLSHLTEKYIFECSRDCIEIPLENIPDESYDYIKEIESRIDMIYNAIDDRCMHIFYEVKEYKTRKEQANVIINKHKNLSTILFNKLDGKPIRLAIYNLIEKELDNYNTNYKEDQSFTKFVNWSYLDV